MVDHPNGGGQWAARELYQEPISSDKTKSLRSHMKPKIQTKLLARLGTPEGYVKHLSLTFLLSFPREVRETE